MSNDQCPAAALELRLAVATVLLVTAIVGSLAGSVIKSFSPDLASVVAFGFAVTYAGMILLLDVGDVDIDPDSSEVVGERRDR